MSSLSIPSRWDRPEEWLLTATRPEVAPIKVNTVKQPATGAHQAIVIRADLQQRLTQVSRYVRIGVQGWAVTAAKRGDYPAAAEIAGDYGALLEQLLNNPSTSGPFLAAEVDSGPVRVRDEESGIEYAYLTILAEIHSA